MSITDDINYKDDWSGECREDPDDGNAYVLRSVEYNVRHGYIAFVNDILGGHQRALPIDTWIAWKRVE